MTHTSAVVNNSTFLATILNEDIELCKIAALLHDYSLFYENTLPKNHGEQSSLFAKNFLSSTSLFSEEEIQKITNAISVHSDKEHVHSSFDEILKDADLLAKYLVDPAQELKDYEKKRLEDAFKKLNHSKNP